MFLLPFSVFSTALPGSKWGLTWCFECFIVFNLCKIVQGPMAGFLLSIASKMDSLIGRVRIPGTD